MNNKSVTTNAILNIVRTFSTLLFPLITFSYASKILLPEGIGKVEFVKNFVMYFTLLASLGINNYGAREAAKLRDSRQELSKFVSEILTINFASTILTYIVFFYIINNVKYLTSYLDLLLIYSLNIAFTVIGVEWIYIALEEYKYITIRTIICQLASLAILFLFVKDRSDYLFYAVTLLISGVGANFLNFIRLRKYVDINPNLRSLDLKKHFKVIFLLFVMVISNNLYSYIDSVIIGFIMDDHAVGLYTASLKFNRIIITVLGAIGAVAMPRLSYLWANGEKNTFEALAHTVFNAILMLGIPALIGAYMLSEYIILLFCGIDFIECIVTMKILTPIILILSISTFFNMHILIPTNNDGKTLKSILVGLILNIILTVMMIPQWGINGVAISTIIGELSVTLLSFYYIKIVLNLKMLFKYLHQYIIASLGVLFGCFVGITISNNIIVKLILSIGISMIVYYLILIKIFKNPYLTMAVLNMESKYRNLINKGGQNG